MAEDSIAKYTAVLAGNPNNELARFSLGHALFDAGRYAEAADSFRICVEKKPDWMVATILLGRCQLQLGDKSAARESLDKGRQLAIAQHHDGPLDEINALLASL